MRLTKFTDYALRVLLLAANRQEDRITIEDAANFYDISQSHLKKVVMELSRAGYLIGTKGRTGGFRLGKDPKEINLGDVLRLTETDFGLFECQVSGGTCVILPCCKLPLVAKRAARAFLAVFDEVTLADVVSDPTEFAQLIPAGLKTR